MKFSFVILLLYLVNSDHIFLIWSQWTKEFIFENMTVYLSLTTASLRVRRIASSNKRQVFSRIFGGYAFLKSKLFTKVDLQILQGRGDVITNLRFLWVWIYKLPEQQQKYILGGMSKVFWFVFVPSDYLIEAKGKIAFGGFFYKSISKMCGTPIPD